MNEQREVRPHDLVGCRYRWVQRYRFPQVAEAAEAVAEHRSAHSRSAVERVLGLLPTRPRIGESNRQAQRRGFSRVDIRVPEEAEDPDARVFATYEALAAGANIITGAEFSGVGSGVPWRVGVDALVRRPDGAYLPVAVSAHRVARRFPKHSGASRRRPALAVPTAHLGLAGFLEVPYQQRHHVIDGYRLGLAARGLAAAGLDSGVGAAIGQDPELAFLAETPRYQQRLDAALAAPPPRGPRRVRECESCPFWFDCGERLRARDDISLLLPGDRGKPFRERGLDTVAALAASGEGEPAALARAWRRGIPVVQRAELPAVPRFDVEIDVDMEAYLDYGAYLWGTFDGERYRSFATWGELGTDAEANNFAAFWSWLRARRAAAEAAGQSFGAFCYSALGENHWLRASARRFAGRAFPGGLEVPSLEEVEAFIESACWVDVFALVKRGLIGPRGLGLKVVAPAAGFAWQEEGFDGAASLEAYREAVGLGGMSDAAVMPGARELLLRYNADDCRANARVRAWLAHGAQGAPAVAELLGDAAGGNEEPRRPR